jgi:FkbM family methyltransferase
VGYAADVGAGCGTTDNNTYLFQQRGWKVLCCEPNPAYFVPCSATRSLFEPVAIGCDEGVHNFNVYKVGGDWGAISGLKIDPRLVRHFRERNLIQGRWVVPVRVCRLDWFLRTNIFPRLDLLSVDTEGTELDVLQSLDLNFWKPLVIVVENNHDEPDCRDYLKQFGYRMVRRNVVNDFFVRG